MKSSHESGELVGRRRVKNQEGVKGVRLSAERGVNTKGGTSGQCRILTKGGGLKIQISYIVTSSSQY